MRVALVIAIILAIVALSYSACGMAMLLSGYVMVGAFQTIPRSPQPSGLDRELVRWGVFFGASLVATIGLVAVYLRHKRTF